MGCDMHEIVYIQMSEVAFPRRCDFDKIRNRSNKQTKQRLKIEMIENTEKKKHRLTNVGFIFPSLLLICSLLVSYTVQAQDIAPNNIPVPWYSQKISGCPYAHCSLASSLMVFDYFKGMNVDAQRSSQEAEQKLIEYQKNYFLKKRAPFKRRTSVGQGGYYSFEIDSLARYYEDMVSATHFMQKDYQVLKEYIDREIPVLVNVRYTGAVRGLRPGPRGHWMVLRGIDENYVWVNDPGRSPEMRDKGENIRYPIKKQAGNPSYFDGCWTGRFIIVTPKEWVRNSLFAQVGKLPPLEEVTQIHPPVVCPTELPEVLRQ